MSKRQTEHKCESQNKPYEKQTQYTNSVEITTNQVKYDLSENVETTTPTAITMLSENIEAVMKLILDKTS